MFYMSLGLRCVEVGQLNVLGLVVMPSPDHTCLLLQEHGERVYTADVCDHMFHFACIVNWLERRANTECPCCRKQLVSEDAVWEAVTASRDGAKAKKKKNKRKNRLDTRRQNDRAAAFDAEDKRDDTLPTPAHLDGMSTVVNQTLDGSELPTRSI
jgi:RING-H2 zinc finger domain